MQTYGHEILKALTLRGDSFGASNLSLFLHRSISVNLPVFPVATGQK